MIKYLYLEPEKKYRFKADINYEKNAKNLSVRYFLNDVFILQHLNVPLSKKKRMDHMDLANLI